MMVGGSQQGILDPGFVLFNTRQQGNWCPLADSIPCYPASQSEKLLVLSRLQVHHVDECHIARNTGPGFPVDYLQPPFYVYTSLEKNMICVISKV
ncbi:unnamed protein product [Schistosoma margrebowiei]|uniref:Uncharacterized protein n=1 Tax=Schistosoma margrebowiei TaxID=48269 RepID=A0A183MVT7_9TREM|nr:unnamed protein product [Schistosoma margrebowiei]